MQTVIVLVLALVFVFTNATSQEDFDNLVTDYWAWRLEDSPEFATQVDVHTFDDRVEEYNIAILDHRKSKVDDYLLNLDKIDRAQLDPTKQVSYDVLKDTLQTYQEGYMWKNYGPMNPVNFLDGIWTKPKATFPSNPTTYDDFMNYTARIKGWGDQALNMMQRMQRAINENTTNNWVSMAEALPQLQDFIGDTAVDNVLYTPFNDILDNSTLSKPEKDQIRQAAISAIGHLRESFSTLKNFTSAEYQNKARKEFGVNSFNNGEDYYKACLKWHLSEERSPEEVHKLGLSEVDRIYGEMSKVLNRLKFNGTVKEFFESLNNDPKFLIKNPQDTIKRFEEIIFDRIKPKLSKYFKNIPDNPVKVEEMPSDGPGGSYTFGSQDGSRPGIFYANVKRPDNNPTYAIVALILHEADPGHHMQDIYSQASTGLHMFRKVVDDSKYFSPPLHFPIYTAYLEGWALYAESLGEELGVYQDDYELMGRYSSEIFRACRLVVDTGLHHYNWSRQRAIDYMLNYTADSEASTTTEINRYITWPGLACAYKIGELKIKELRAKAEHELGDKFDIRDFHSVMLDNGPVPLHVLEQLVNDWIVKTNVDTFAKIVEEYWAWRLEDAPEFATNTEFHKWDARVEQYTIDVLDQRKVKVEGYLKRLLKLDTAELAPTDQISYDILTDTLETYLAGYKWKYYGPMNPVNFLEGLLTDPLRYFPANPKTYKEFFDYLTRMFGWADQALNMIVRMRRAIQEKTTNNWVSVNGSLSQIDNLIGDNATENIFYKRIQDALVKSPLSEGNRTALLQNCYITVVYLQRAYTSLKEFILTEYKNNTRTAYGVNSFKDGADYYKACLRWHLSTNITPEAVHSLGLKEVDRIYGEMNVVLERLKFNGTVKEFFHSLESESRFFLKTPEEILKAFEDIIFKRVKPKLPQFFENIPNMPVKVEPMPTDGPGGMYMSGSPDGSRPGVFYANVRRPKDNPTYGMPALALHEADPGHHLQDIYSQASTGIPEFRKVIDYEKYFSIPMHFPFYTAYTEGWGLYSESLGEKDYLDIYQDDYELMGRYSMEIFRACRLVVDTGLHYYSWTRERAIQYMLNYTAESEASVSIEIDRYITWPGQACAYKVGEMKIKELREHAKTELGAAFDIKEFHSVILDNGAMPLEILERLVNQWIHENQDTSDNLNKIMSDYFEWRLKSSPAFATYFSYKYNDQLETFNFEFMDSQLKEAKQFLKRLKFLDKGTLAADRQISYDVLKDMLNTFIAGYKWHNYGPLNPFNFLNSWFGDVGSFATGIPFDTQGDFINYVVRLEKLPNQLDEMIAFCRKAIELGHTNNNGSMLRMMDSLGAGVNTEPINSPLYKPFNLTAERLFGNRSTAIGDRLQAAVQAALDKIASLKSFLEKEYLPNTRQGFGVGSLPNGLNLYRDCLKWHTSLDLSPEKVHNTGLQEVDRIAGLMKKTIARLGFPENTEIKEVYKNMTSNSTFLLKTGDEMLQRYRDIIFHRIQPLISKYFKDAPSLPLEVKASKSDGIGGSYSSVAEDGSRPGIFYANVRRPEDNPTYKMVSLSLHEAVPGHHLAESYSAVSSLPAFRKHMEWRAYSAPYYFPFYNSYVEGWALYAEYLGEEMGIYHDDSELMGRYSDEMLRAVRLVVDTGIHYYNWTRARAIDYMLNYTAESPQSAAIEIDRYSTWPGQACGYKLGELEIKKLRHKAEQVLGNKFVLSDFHYTILKNGPMPLNILGKVIDDWTDSVVVTQPTAAPPSCSTLKTSGSQAPMISSICFFVVLCAYINGLIF